MKVRITIFVASLIAISAACTAFLDIDELRHDCTENNDCPEGFYCLNQTCLPGEGDLVIDAGQWPPADGGMIEDANTATVDSGGTPDSFVADTFTPDASTNDAGTTDSAFADVAQADILMPDAGTSGD